LVKVFFSQKRDVIFMESAIDTKRQRHTYIDCVPLSAGDGEEAPIYFKKAIMESESEWSQHKKLINTTGIAGGVKRCIPQGFNYFSVEFGMDGGFVHVVEKEKEFNPQFGREIVAGMMALDIDQWKHPRNETYEDIKKQMAEFLKQWDPFDWTKQLDA